MMTYIFGCDWDCETAEARERRVADRRRREEDAILRQADAIRARRKAEAGAAGDDP